MYSAILSQVIPSRMNLVVIPCHIRNPRSEIFTRGAALSTDIRSRTGQSVQDRTDDPDEFRAARSLLRQG